MHVQPYLFFDGRCDEALEFYKKTLGAEPTMLMRFKDAPDQSHDLARLRRTKSCMGRSRSATRRC